MYFAQRAALLLSISFALLTAERAQTGHGSITGLLTDGSGGAIYGAAVTLQPTNAQAVTDRQGSYTFADVTPGNYTLAISFIGFAPYSSSVIVVAGQTTSLNATLKVAEQAAQVIVTDAHPHGEAEAINLERTAPNILQVLPAEVIRSLPNANVADAIGRLPGVTLERDEGEGKYVQIRGTEPRYSNVTIDGVNVPSPDTVRQIKLDIIPSNLVESVQLSKTLQANQGGDAIGGSVSLRTRTAGDRPTISLFGIGAFTPIFNTRDADQFGGTLGQRFGKKKRLGILFGGTYDWNGRGINDVEPSPTTTQLTAGGPYYGTYSGEDLRDYAYNRTRYGFEGAVDHRLNDTSSLSGAASHAPITLISFPMFRSMIPPIAPASATPAFNPLRPITSICFTNVTLIRSASFKLAYSTRILARPFIPLRAMLRACMRRE